MLGQDSLGLSIQLEAGAPPQELSQASVAPTTFISTTGDNSTTL